MPFKITPFLLKISIFSVILYLAYHFLEKYIPRNFYFAHTHYLFLFFFAVTIFFHFGLLNSASKDNKVFVSFYMIGTAIKLFLFLTIIIIYALLNRDQAVAFISNFFMLYVFYTVFEVSLVYFYFGKNNIESEAAESNENPEEGY